MTPKEIGARLAVGGQRFAFDTNAFVQKRTLTAVCTNVARWNESLMQSRLRPIELIAPAPAYVERLFDLKQDFKDRYNPSQALTALANKGVRIASFEERHVTAAADRLGDRYPTTEKWHEAKRVRCLECLGLSRGTVTPGNGQSCGATIDWIIGAYAAAEDCVIVTDDRGPEYRGLAERTTLAALREALDDVLAASGGP